MKRMQRKDLVVTIRESFVSFFAITMFIALGIALYLGINWTAEAMHVAFDQAFDAGHAHHVDVTFPYGLTKDDLSKLARLEGVDEVEAGYVSYERGRAGGEELTLRIESVPQAVDAFLEVEGTLPTKTGQIAVEAHAAARCGIALGDAIDLAQGQDDAPANLVETSYRVVALVVSPAFLSCSTVTYGVSTVGSGEVDLPAWVVEDAFDEESFLNAKPHVLVRSDALEGLSTFSQEYEAVSSALEERVRKLGARLGTSRFDDIYAEGEAQVDGIQALVDQTSQSIAKGKRELAQAKKDIEQGKKDIEQGKKDLARKTSEAQAQLASARSQLDASRAAWNASNSQLQASKAQLAEANRQYQEAESIYRAVESALADLRAASAAGQGAAQEGLSQEEVDAVVAQYAGSAEVLRSYGIAVPATITAATVNDAIASGNAFLAQARDQPFTMAGETVTLNTAGPRLQQMQAQANAAQDELNRAKAELDRQEARYAEAQRDFESQKAAAQKRIADAEKRVEQGQKEVKAAEKELKAGERELEDAKASVEEGRAALDELKSYSWVVTPRTQSAGLRYLEVFAEMARSLRWSMASLFLVIGLLVCYSAISRIVHDHARRIGTKRAMGFTRREVASLFFGYAGSCVAIGAIVGVAAAVLGVEPVLLRAFDGRFAVGGRPFFSVGDAVPFVLLELALILLATYVAVRDVLRLRVVELLAGGARPRARRRFFEGWRVWRRLGLLGQITISNTLHDRRRLVGTLVGVMGCTALILCAVMVDDNVMRSFDRQYDAIYHYDTTVALTGEGDESKGMRLLEDADMGAAAAFARTLTLRQPDGEQALVTLTVPLSDDFGEYVTLARPDDAQPDDARASSGAVEGVWVSHAYQEHFGAMPGGVLTVLDSVGTEYELSIAGFFEHRLPSFQVVMDQGTYEKTFGSAPFANRLLVDTRGKGADAAAEVVGSMDGYVATTDSYATAQRNFVDFASVARGIVAVYLALAVVMAASVLLNLNHLYVEEKRHDLLVLMVCGYSLKEAKGYVWHDSVVLAAVGILMGQVLGTTAGAFALRSIEQANMSFLHGVSWLAVGMSVAGSVVLAVVTLLGALRRIDSFDLADVD